MQNARQQAPLLAESRACRNSVVRSETATYAKLKTGGLARRFNNLLKACALSASTGPIFKRSACGR
jgi:hypothetical protein